MMGVKPKVTLRFDWPDGTHTQVTLVADGYSLRAKTSDADDVLPEMEASVIRNVAELKEGQELWIFRGSRWDPS